MEHSFLPDTINLWKKIRSKIDKFLSVPSHNKIPTLCSTTVVEVKYKSEDERTENLKKFSSHHI